MSRIIIPRRKFIAQASGIAGGLILGGNTALAARAPRPPGNQPFVDGRIEYGDFAYSADMAIVGGETHEGVEIQIDLPHAQHIKNIPAPRDGKGLCVFASMTMTARWHNVRPLFDVMHKIPYGGGWPDKVDETIRQYASGLHYVQYQGTDPSILDKALSQGRMACVTYGYSERYQMQTIYHMVCLAHLDAKWAAILDNNYPGTYEWMPRAEFLKRWIHPTGQGWAYVFLAPPPPPIPHN